MEGGWDAKYNLDSKSQGTGMPSEDAAALRLDPWAEFPTYMSAVFSEADAYLATLSDDDLSKNVMVKPFGESPLLEVIDTTVMNHGFSHLGELWALKGLQGMKGSPSDRPTPTCHFQRTQVLPTLEGWGGIPLVILMTPILSGEEESPSINSVYQPPACQRTLWKLSVFK